MLEGVPVTLWRAALFALCRFLRAISHFFLSNLLAGRPGRVEGLLLSRTKEMRRKIVVTAPRPGCLADYAAPACPLIRAWLRSPAGCANPRAPALELEFLFYFTNSRIAWPLPDYNLSKGESPCVPLPQPTVIANGAAQRRGGSRPLPIVIARPARAVAISLLAGSPPRKAILRSSHRDGFKGQSPPHHDKQKDCHCEAQQGPRYPPLSLRGPQGPRQSPAESSQDTKSCTQRRERNRQKRKGNLTNSSVMISK